MVTTTLGTMAPGGESHKGQVIAISADTSVEVTSDDDDHKKSISDVLFSARKASPPTSQSRPLQDVIESKGERPEVAPRLQLDTPASPALAYGLDDEPQHTNSNANHNDMSSSSPVLTTSQDDQDDDATSTDTNSYSERNVNQLILDTPCRLYHQDEMTSKSDTTNIHSVIRPTLAVQEDVSDYITMTTPQCTNSEVEKSESAKAASAARRSTHVRNPSLLSGTAAQTIQFITGSPSGSSFPEPGTYLSCLFCYSLKTISKSINETINMNTFNLVGRMTKTVPSSQQHNQHQQQQQVSKRPLYVYVDYSYEEQMLEKLNTSVNKEHQKEKPETVEQRGKYESPSSRKNLNDLLSSTCSSHLGNPIESFVPNGTAISSTSMCVLLNGDASSSGRVMNCKSKSNGCVMTSASSSTTTCTSSTISSNDENNLAVAGDVDASSTGAVDQTPISARPPVTKYRQANVTRLINKDCRTLDSQVARTVPVPPNVPSRAGFDARLSASLLDSATANTFVKSNYLTRPRPKDLDGKHETSV